MENIKNMFKIKFKEEDIEAMEPLDGIISIIYFLYYMVLLFCFVKFLKSDAFINWSKYFSNMSMYRFIIYIPYTVLTILPTILITYFRRQKISTIGIRRTKIMKSIILGIIFSLPVSIPNIRNGVISNYNIKNLESLIWELLYYLISIAVVEEMVFRGFIQTRIRGIIKNKWISIWVVGFMFSFIHIPLQILQTKLSLIEFMQSNITNLIMIAFVHIYFVYIYTRDNNIIAPIITHFIWNFSGNLFV